MVIDLARPLPGGPLAIDLLNTVWETAEGSVDWLESDMAVEAFVTEYNHSMKGVDVSAARSALTQARELSRRLLDSESSVDELLAEVNAVLESARTVVVLTKAGLTLTVTGDQPYNGLAIEALVNAVELRRDHPSRVRCCEHESCVLWFLDTSKGGRRRWCSMERCGNRSKAQRHYQRQTADR